MHLVGKEQDNLTVTFGITPYECESIGRPHLTHILRFTGCFLCVIVELWSPNSTPHVAHALGGYDASRSATWRATHPLQCHGVFCAVPLSAWRKMALRFFALKFASGWRTPQEAHTVFSESMSWLARGACLLAGVGWGRQPLQQARCHGRHIHPKGGGRGRGQARVALCAACA